MASMVPPQYGVAYIFYVTLVSQANTKIMQVTPTLAAGDATLSIDGAATANLATLPVVTPAGSRRVKVSLSATEMQGDNIGVLLNDVSGAEWCDVFINIQTSGRRIDDLAYPATSGRSTAIDASGQVTVGAIAANAITATAINADAITAAKIADGAIDAAAFAAGAINAAAIATDAITAAKIAADAIGASELAADAVTEIQTGLSTLTAAGVRTAVGLASANLDTQLDALPTNAELATALAGADDATLAAIAALSIPTVADILAAVVEGSITLKGAMRLMLAVLANKSSGGGTTTLTFRDVADAKARVTATVTADGNRTAITRDITD